MNLKNYFQGKTYMFLTIIKSRGATMSQSRKVMSQQYHLPLMFSLQCFVERIVAIMKNFVNIMINAHNYLLFTKR